jgi:protein-disulfide isomerase
MSEPDDPKQRREQLREQRLAAESSDSKSAASKRRVQYGALAFFIAAALIGGLIAISQSGGGDDNGSGSAAAGNVAGSTEVNAELNGIAQSKTVLGDAKAPVTVIEYGDLQCPVCREFSLQTAPTLVDMARSGEIKYDFRQWTIIGPDSTPAGAAAMAAGEQGRYWQFIQLFYRNQGPENGGYVTDDFLASIAKGAGVPDLATWKTDSDPAKWTATFKQDDADATAAGFTGTPSISVVGPGGRKDLGGSTIPQLADIQSAIAAVQ